MARPRIITALDIGSHSAKILSVVKNPGENELKVIGQAQSPSFGVRRGVVIDTSRVSGIISTLKEKMFQESGAKIEKVYSNVGGAHIQSTFSKGLVSVSRADRKISEEDIDRVLQAAQTFHLPSNKEILEIFPKEFIVDGEGGIKDALGMEGVRLEAEILVMYGFSPYVNSPTQAAFQAGIEIKELIPSPLASSRAVLTPREKELGVLLLDIGAGTCDMAVFEEENLIHAAVFPVGSGHITNDIAICLKTDIDTAEKIKLEFGSLVPKASSKIISVKNEKNVTIDAAEPLVFSRKSLSAVVEARVGDIFDFVSQELKKIGRQGSLPSGAVLTGGGSKLPGIKEFAKRSLKLPVRTGFPRGILSLKADPELSVVCGLILEGADLETASGSDGGGFKSFLKKAVRNFIP